MVHTRSKNYPYGTYKQYISEQDMHPPTVCYVLNSSGQINIIPNILHLKSTYLEGERGKARE